MEASKERFDKLVEEEFAMAKKFKFLIKKIIAPESESEIKIRSIVQLRQFPGIFCILKTKNSYYRL